MCDFIKENDLADIPMKNEDIKIIKASNKKEFYLTLSIIFRKQKDGLKIIGKGSELQGIIKQNLSNNELDNIYFYPESDFHISLVNFITHRHNFVQKYSNESIEEFKQNLLSDNKIATFQQEIFDYFSNIYLNNRHIGMPNLRAYYDFLYCRESIALQVFIPSDLAKVCSNLMSIFNINFPFISKKLYPRIDLPRRAVLNLMRFNDEISNNNLQNIIINYNKEAMNRFNNQRNFSFEIDRLSLVVSDDILSNQSPEIMPIYLTK